MRVSSFALIFLIFSLAFSGLTVSAAPASPKGLYLSQEERTFFAYALLAAGTSPAEKSKILARAGRYFQKVYSQPPRDVAVRSFSEYVRELQGEWPDTESLALDLQILERREPRAPRRIFSHDPNVQRLIQEHEARQFESAKDAAFSANLAFIGRKLTAYAQSGSPFDINEIFSLVLEDADRLLLEQFSELERIGDKMSRVAFGATGDEAMSLVLRTLFSGYYGRLGPASKKLIINAFLGQDLRADDITKLETMIQTSGPQFQKLIQAFANQKQIPPKLRAIFRRLERSVRPVPFHQVKEILARNSDLFNLIQVEEKRLGTGTMAQAHRGVLEDNEKRTHEVVVRFIKPGIARRVKEDERVVSELAKVIDTNPEYVALGGPKMTPLANESSATVRAELDQQRTMKNQEEASVYRRSVLLRTPEYKTSIQFLVPKVYHPRGDRPSELLVQEYLPGQSLEKSAAEFSEAIPGLKVGMSEAVATLWLEELLFGSGYFHSDLHPGNYAMNVIEPAITVTLMDYGMAGRLSKTEQEQIIVLTAAIEVGDPEKIARALWGLIGKDKSAESFDLVRRFAIDFQARITRGSLPVQGLQQWLAGVSDTGLGLTENLVNVNRGAFIIDQMLEESGSRKRLADIGLDLARSRMVQVAHLLIEKGGFTAKELARLGLQDAKTRLLPVSLANALQPKPAIPSCKRIYQP